jgi:Mor family transcriptional regulator
VACIGLDATRKLLTAYGGKKINLPKPLVFFQAQRNVMITKDFLSGNYKKSELVAKWGLSYKTISKIIEETQDDPLYQHWLK